MSGPPGDARLVSTGTFKLDRSRAVDKLAHFQLADPRDYVRELVAAAVCAGATEIRVRNDADDFELEWDGAHPELDDLNGFFDAIFHRGSDRRGRMLQHLAQGVFGALGMEPRWVRLMRPGLTLDLTDPKNPTSIENDRKQGVRIEIRERFGLEVAWEWGRKPFTEPEELTRLRVVAMGCPVPIMVDGTPLDLDLSRHLSRPTSGVVRVEQSDPAATGEVWLSAHAPDSAGIALVRDGVQVDHKPVNLHGVRVVGYVRCDALRLDASQSSVVEDDTWTALVGAVEDAVRRLLHDFLSTCDGPPPSRSLLLARELVSGPGDLLSDVPLFADLQGQLWSVDALSRAPRVLVTKHDELFDRTLDLPQLLGETRLLHRLKPWFPSRVSEGTRELRARGRGRARRAALAARATPFAVDAPYTLAIEADGTRMRIGVSPEDADWNDILVEFRIDGLPVFSVHEKGPGPVLVRVEHDHLTADATFSKVIPGSLRLDLLGHARVAALKAVLAAVTEHPHHPDIRTVFRRHVLWALPRKRRGKAAPALPQNIRQVAFFPHSKLGFASIDQLAAEARAADRLDTRDRALVWFVPGGETLPDPDANVLQLDPPDVDLLQKVFGGRLINVGRRLASEAEARRRRREGRAEARLPADVACVETVELDLPKHALTGIAGLRTDPGAVGCPCTVVREGVVLGELDLPVNLPGLIVAVEWSEAEPVPDWSRLANPNDAAMTLAEQLEPTLLALTRGAARERTDLLGPLPDWLVALLMRGPEQAAELADRPFVRSASGEVRLLGQPVNRKRRGGGGLHLLPPGSPVPDHLRGAFHIADADHQRILQAWHGTRDVRDGRPRLKQYQAKHRNFRRSTTLPWCLPVDSIAGVRRADADLEVWMGLDGRKGAKNGFDVSLRYEARELERVYRKGTLPWRAVVRGPLLQPNEAHTACTDVQVVRRVMGVVRELRAEALEQLVQDIASPGADEATLRLGMHVLLELLRRRMRWLGAPRSRQLREQLEEAALFMDARGSRHTLAKLRVAHAEGRLGTLRRLPDGVVQPPEAIWLHPDSSADTLLQEELGSRPFDATAEAVQQAQGIHRRASVPRTPLAESGPHVADKVVSFTLAGIEGEGRMWLALSPGQPGERRYRVDGRVVTQDRLPELPGVRLAIEHPALEPSASFDSVGPRPVVQDLRRVSMEAVYGLVEAVLSKHPPPALVDLAVRILAAHRHRTPPLTADPAALSVSHGPPLPLSCLRTLTELRFAPEGTTGRPLQGSAPVFVGRPARRKALETWGKVTDATESLAREEAAWRRRSGPVASVSPPPDVLATIEIPAPRSGRLFLVRSQKDGVVVRVDGRALTTRPVGTPLPLVGHVDDPAVRADPWFERIADRRVKTRLDDVLKQCSDALLLELMGRRTPPQKVLLQTILRSFSGKDDIHRARGARAQLARHDLFEVGTAGERCSLLDLAQTPSGPRLHSGSHGYNSLDHRRPLVRVPEAHLNALVKMLGATDATKVAAQEHAASHRRKARPLPFELEGSTWLAELKRSRGRSKWVAGLHEDTELPGRVDIRVKGRPAGSVDVDAPGMRVIVELDPRKVSPLDPTPDPDKNLLRAIVATYSALIDAAGDALVAGPARIQRLCRVVHSVHDRLWKGRLPAKRAWQRPWLEAPLLHGPDGKRHTIGAMCRVVARDGLVLWATSNSDTSADLLLTQDALSRAVVDVLGWGSAVQSAQEWEAKRLRQHAAEEALKQAHARSQRIKRTRGELQTLLEALHRHRKVPAVCARRSIGLATTEELVAADDFPALAALAWRLADAEAVAQQGAGGQGAADVTEQLAAFLVHRLGITRPPT